MSAEHRKGDRPSTAEKHEKGQARKRKDAGWEKGDGGLHAGVSNGRVNKELRKAVDAVLHAGP